MSVIHHGELKAKLLKLEARKRAAHLADQLADFDRSVDQAAAEPDETVRARRFAELEDAMSSGLALSAR